MKELGPREQEGELREERMTPGETLRFIRKKRSLTQEKLGQILGRDFSFISAVERGRRKFPPAMFLDLTGRLKLEPEEVEVLTEALRFPLTVWLLDEFLKNEEVPINSKEAVS